MLEQRKYLGIRKGTRALGSFKQSVLILCWFLDCTRLIQLARSNRISVPTAYRYLHEGLTALADHAPHLFTALERAAAVGFAHLDGTVIHWALPKQLPPIVPTEPLGPRRVPQRVQLPADLSGLRGSGSN